MLEQFRQNLRVTLDVSKIQPNGIPEHLAAYNEAIEELLGKKEFSWNDAYEVEKRLAHVRPAASLQSELDTQIASLERVSPENFRLFKQMNTTLTEEFKDDKVEWEAPSAWSQPYVIALRSLLEQVLNEVHWKYAQRYYCRKIKERYTTKVSAISVGLLVLFLIVIYAVAQHRYGFLTYAGLEIAFFAGLLGASFSILTGTRNNYTVGATIEDMLRETGNASTLVRISVGGIAAVMLYFFFESSLLAGTIIPELPNVGFAKTLFDEKFSLALRNSLDMRDAVIEPPALLDNLRSVFKDTDSRDKFVELLAQRLNPSADDLSLSARLRLGNFVPNSELCKLLIWSFAAGFSEKLVPSVLAKVQPAEKEN
ncbi:hypothetical protein OA90_16195 [Labrenzia sp. OB1]|nr:hypothetical protein OA90_16195 [Labrenzia sp. OB1]